MNTLEKEFGNPEELGRAIAKAKGRFKTYLKKEMRPHNLIIALAIIVPLLFAISSHHTVGDNLPVGIEHGNYVLVNKLAKSYTPKDIILTKNNGNYTVWSIKEVQSSTDKLLIEKPGRDLMTIAKNDVIGRVFLQIR